MQDYKVVFSGQDNLSPQVKKIKGELEGLSNSAVKIDKIEQKFNKITNSTAPLQRKLKDLQTIMANMKYDGLDKTDTFRKVTAEAQRLQKALQGAKEEINGIKNKGSQLEGIFSKIKVGGGGGIASAIGSISSIGAIAGTAATGIGLLTAKVADLANEGIELAMQAEGIKHRFEQIGGTAVYLEDLRTHTHGLVNDLDLMKATVKAKDFNIPMKDLGTYLEFAQLKAQQTGESVDYLVDSIVTGLGRQSVQILDNLGISAAELKNKMAQGKTMTEAVAEVINTQLSQAGEHFETEAEKAQRKLIELQNEQMRVGENLAPLKTDWQNFLTSIEIWAMKTVAKLGELFSEAQRIKNLQNDMYGGGNGKPSRADREIEYFKKIGTDQSRKNGLRNTEDKYNREINKLSGEIQKVKDQIARERKNGADVHSTLNLTTQLKQLVDQRTAARAERDKALKGMKAVMKSKNTKTTITDPDPNHNTPKGGGKIPRVRTEKESPKDKIISKGTDRFETELRKNALNDEGIKIPYEFVPKKTPEQVKEEILGDTSTWTDELQGNIDKLFEESRQVQMRFDTGELNADEAQAILDQISQMIGLDIPIKLDTSKIDEANKALKGVGSTIDNVGGAFASLGQSMEIPELNILGVIAQAVANLMLSYADAAKSPAVTSTGWGWIAFAAAGLATALTAAASIKSAASGFATGGIVGGSSYSGDKLIARVNSGEMILPAKKASELGDMLSTNASENYLTVDWKLKGSDLYGSLSNFSKVKAKSGKITGIK